MFMILYINELTNHIRVSRTRILADSAYLVNGGVCMLKISARPLLHFWKIVKAKSKTMGFWIRRRPLLSTYHKISDCISLLWLEKLLFSRCKGLYHGFRDVLFCLSSFLYNLHISLVIYEIFHLATCDLRAHLYKDTTSILY